MLTRPAYRADIDGLRALAVLGVLFYHAFPQWVGSGFIGVDVFFVISGYLIGTIVMDSCAAGTLSLREFYARRIRRIFPALLVVLPSCFALGWLLLVPEDYMRLGIYIAAGAGFSSNFVSLHENGYFDYGADSKPLLHLWSLGIEEQFYLLFPVAIMLAKRWWRWLNSCLLAVIIASYFANLDSPTTATAFFLPYTRFWELLLGALLSRLMSEGATASRADHALSVAGLACIIIGSFTLPQNGFYPGWMAVIPVWGTLALIAAGPNACINRTLLSHPLMVAIGLISYPLYLWHWPLLSFLRIYRFEPQNPLWNSAALMLSLALAWLTYRYIETPIRSRPSARTALILCALMAIAGCSGLLIYHENGVPQRYPVMLRQLVSLHIDPGEHWRTDRCYLNGHLLQKRDFSDECTDSSTHPSIVLWGDSHAASLYPGFKKMATEHGFALSQYTSPSCPPIMDFQAPANRGCRASNSKTLQKITLTHPDCVVLAARWDGLYGYHADKLINTVTALKKISVPHIVLIGKGPIWREALSIALLHFWESDPLHRVPDHMRYGLDVDPAIGDQQMRQLAHDLDIDYISAYDTLCNAEGCLTRLGDEPEDLAYFDNDHLSPRASEYFVQQIFGYFIK